MFNTNDLFNTKNECYVYKAIHVVYSFQDSRYYTWWLTKTSLYQLISRLPIQESYIRFWETWPFFASTIKWETRYCKGNAAKLYFPDYNPHNNKQSLKATKYLCNQVLQSPFSPIQLPQTRRKQTCLTMLLKMLQQIISDCLDYALADEPDDILCTKIYFSYYKKWMAPKALQLRDMSWYMHVSTFLKRKTLRGLDLHKSQEVSILILHLRILWLEGVGRLTELALGMKDCCLAGKLSRILAQTLLDFSRLQASKNLLWIDSQLKLSSQLLETSFLNIDLQALPRVFLDMDKSKQVSLPQLRL